MAVAHVQTVRTSDHTGVGTAVTLPSYSTGAAALVLVAVAAHDGGAGNPTITQVQLDATTNSSPDKVQLASSGDSRGYIFSFPNVGSGAHTIIVTRSSAPVSIEAYVMEVSGAATSSPTDGAGSSTTGTSTNPASGNFTSSASDSFWLGFFMNENGGTDATVAAGSGWTMPADPNGRVTGATGGVVSGVEYRANPASTGPFNAQFTAASATWVALQQPYKVAGGGGGGGGDKTGLLLRGAG